MKNTTEKDEAQLSVLLWQSKRYDYRYVARAQSELPWQTNSVLWSRTKVQNEQVGDRAPYLLSARIVGFLRRGVKSGDAPQDGEPLAYDELFSALRYYAGMNKQEILTSSRAYLMSLYSRYVKRACENLGVPSDGENARFWTDDRPASANGGASWWP